MRVQQQQMFTHTAQSVYKRAEEAKKRKIKRQTASATADDLQSTHAEIMIKVMFCLR